MINEFNRRDYLLIYGFLIGTFIILFIIQFHSAVSSITADGRGLGDSLYSVFLLISLLGFIGIILVTTRMIRIYQEKLVQSQAAEKRITMFAAALQSTPVGVMIRDLRQAGQPIVFINRAFSDLTGYEAIDLRGKDLGFLLGARPNPEHLADMQQNLARHQSYSFATQTYRKDSSSFWCEWHVSPLLDKQGNVTHIVKFFADITNFRNASDALGLAKEQAERANAIKANFVATMSHEIRTPINGMMGIMNVLAEESLTAEQHRMLNIAIASGENLREIVSDVLDYSKMEAGKVEIETRPFNLQQLIADLIDLSRFQAEKKGLSLQVMMSKDLSSHVQGDPQRLRQILLNLISNAIKYTETGRVTLHVTQLIESKTKQQSVGMYRFEVVDTGIGISTPDQNRLFERFTQLDTSYTRRAAGTGLGLVITRQLVQLMNGEIGVDSRPGQGSKFWVVLPLQIDAVPKLTQPETRSTSSARYIDARILVAEDNPANLIVTQRYLEKAGCKVDCAFDGLEALKMAETTNYDLILMDVSMPNMDGIEAVQRLRMGSGASATQPVIALTAHVQQSDIDRCLDAGMSDYLSKPVSYPELTAMLDKCLPSQPPSPPTEDSIFKVAASILPDTNEINHDIFNGSRLQRLSGEIGEAKTHQVVQIYLEDSAKRMRRIMGACPSTEFSIIQAEAHALKSSSADLGLEKLAALLARLEQAANEKNQIDIYTLLLELSSTYISSRNNLKKHHALLVVQD